MLLPEIASRYFSSEIITKNIPKSILDQILEAGRLSPSVKNRQPWRFIAITNLQTKLELQKACFGEPRCSKGAIIAVCSAASEYKMSNGLNANLFDMGVASSQMMLQAEKEGLASEAITSFSQEDVCRILTLPYSMYVGALLLLGYTESNKRIDMRLNQRLPVQRTINYQSW